MTYCLALRLDGGLVLLSDTRTNAGVDNISTYRKLHILHAADDRIFVLQSAGSLATTHEVLDRVALDLHQGAPVSLATVDTLGEAALYLGRLGNEIAHSHQEALPGGAATATFILSGQVGAGDPDILLVYPEGNYIRASEDKPYLQIGESKYGKFMLDLAANPNTPITTATKIAVASMISTARANLSVGPPYDLAIYVRDGFAVHQFRIDADSELLTDLRELWERHVHLAVAEMPLVPIDLEPLR
jgi:putative proteasome-type protease